MVKCGEKEEEYKPKRGDLIEFIGSDDVVGLVAGWIDEETLVILTLPDRKYAALYFDGSIEILAKKEELSNPTFLPTEVRLRETSDISGGSHAT